MSRLKNGDPISVDDHELSQAFFVHAMTPANLGSIPQPDGSSALTGRCGDTMEISLRLDGEIIQDIRFLPHGCLHTVACGSALTSLARGLTIDEALKITPERIEDELGGLPADHRHCAELAVASLWEAAMDYYQSRRAGWKKLYERRPSGPISGDDRNPRRRRL